MPKPLKKQKEIKAWISKNFTPDKIGEYSLESMIRFSDPKKAEIKRVDFLPITLKL